MRILQTLYVVLAAPIVSCMHATAAIDTVMRDNGVPSGAVNSARPQWEESVILSPGRSCRVVKILVYYGSGTGQDEVRLTGDASEGTIPPTQFCFSYNTLAAQRITVTKPGWVEIDVRAHGVVIGGFDRVVVQHVMKTGGPVWGQDNNGQIDVTSFLYDPISPNPNFYNIPGIYYRATGDYMVRLMVEDVVHFRPAPQLLDVTSAMGLTNTDGSAIRSDQASIVDIDADGLDDVYIGGLFFHNDSGNRFTRMTVPMGGGPTSWADVDNDGDKDCFVLAGNLNDKLWRNDGNGLFTDVTSSSQLRNDAPTITALWFDMDHDGDLDVFLANGRREVNGQETYFQDKLWRNNGNMVFSDVTTSSQIAAGEPSPFFDTWGASLCDFNNDGWTDIFVATYRLAPDRLYRNNKNGTFTEVSRETETIGMATTQPEYFGHGMGSEWADIDADGDVDLAVGNLGHPDSRAQYSNPSLIFLNNGTPQAPSFKNWYSTDNVGILNWHGVKFREMNAGMCFSDLDQDGSQDLWHGQISYEAYGAGANRPAHVYMGSTTPGVSFSDQAWELGMFIHGAWTAVRFDFDRDGDLDLLCASGTENVKLFRNDLEKRGNSVTLRLRDATASSHQDAYGAHVTVWAQGKAFHRWLPGTVSGGRMSQMTDDVHVGIGAAKVDSIVAQWPGGTTTRTTLATENQAWALSSNGTVTSLATGRASLVSPARGSVNNPISPTLRWNATRTGTYDVQISTDANFSDVITALSVYAKDTLDFTLGTANATYFWRVRISGQTWSSTWDFTIGMPSALPVSLMIPFNSAVNVPTTVQNMWHPTSFAGSLTLPTIYTLEYALNNLFTDGKQQLSGIKDTTMGLSDLLPARTYHWHVRADNEFQNGDWSPTWQFTTYDTPGAVDLVFPADNSSNVSMRPRFSWTRRAEADRGYELLVDTTELFSTPITRKASDTSISITPPFKANKRYYWQVRGINYAGAGMFSETFLFVTGSTTGVDIDIPFREAAETIEIFDILGRIIASGSFQDKDVLLHNALARGSGYMYCVERNNRGNVLTSYPVIP